MKQYTRKKLAVCSLGQLLALSVILVPFLAIPTFADETFLMQADGSIQAGGNLYANFDEYTRSDYFRDQGKRCGTKMPQLIADDAAAKSVNDCTFYLTNIQNEYWPGETYVAQVWFHVIYRADGTGIVSDTAIQDQIRVLNEDYRAKQGTMGSQGFDTRIEFELAGVTRTQNDAWFNEENDPDVEGLYKQALNKDPSKYINVYTNDAQGFLGYAYFPQGSAGQAIDGITMNYKTIGGRNNGYGAYDQGRTLVHEMGHYLGLYHTFEDGASCSNTYSGGDLIVDTPAEEEAHFGCTPSNTCGTADPIHNYMDYTDDICMYQFTREQSNRAVCSMVNYRPGIYSIDQPPGPPPGQEDDISIVPPILTPLMLSK